MPGHDTARARVIRRTIIRSVGIAEVINQTICGTHRIFMESRRRLLPRARPRIKPEGLIEHEIIDDLVFNRLHKRRIDIAMTREFSKATVEKAIEPHENKERPVARYWLRLANVLGKFSAEPAERVRPDICIGTLEKLMEKIGDRGPEPGDLALLRIIYGDQPTEHAALTMRLLADVPAGQSEKDEVARRELQESVLETLQTEVEVQKNRMKLANNLIAIECGSDLQEPRPSYGNYYLCGEYR